MIGIFCVLFQIFGPIFSVPHVAARIATFSYPYQLTDNTNDESNIDATSYNSVGYVTYERNGTIYMKQWIGTEETVGSGSNPVIDVYLSVPHIIYFSEWKIKYTYESWSSWTNPIDLTSVVNPTSADFRIDSNGYIHLTYSRNSSESYDDLYYVTNTSGSFVESNFCHWYYWSWFWWQYCWHPVWIALDSNNYFYIAYKSWWRDSTPSYSTQSMAYYTNSPSGNAGSPWYNWNTSAVTTSKNNISIDANDTVYIVYWAWWNRYLGKVTGGLWNDTPLGSWFSDYSITSDTGIVGITYNDGSNNLNYISDTGGWFGSAEIITTGTYPIITFNWGEKFLYNLQNDGSDDEVWLQSMNSIYTVPWQIDNIADSFVLANGGTVNLSNLEIGWVYMLMDGATIVSSGVLIATGSNGSLSLNPLAFPSYGNYTLTLSGSYNSTTTASIDTVTLYIGPFDYQDLYVNQIAPTLLSGGIRTNLGDVTYANVQGFSRLYFEKDGLWKISFASSLDLTNSGTITFLQNLPSKLDMSNGLINFDPTDSDFVNYGAALSMYFDTGSTFVTGISDPASFVVKSSTGVIISSSGVLSNIMGACGVGDPYCTLIFDTAHFTSFDLKPVLIEVSLRSDNTYSWALAKNGDRLILEFTASEALTGSSIGFDNPSVESVEDLWWNRYRATSVPLDLTWPIMPNVEFGIWPKDLSGNSGDQYTTTTDGSSVRYDIISPTAEILYNPVWTWTTAGDVVATLANQSEDIVVTNNSWSFMYTFTENGSFTFEFRDLAGNTGSTTATVAHINKSMPVITLNGSGSINIEQGSSYTELGATWSDQTDGTWGVSTLSGSIDTNTLWVQQMEYIYVNSLWVTGSTIRTINIVDTVAPPAPTITTASMITSGSSLPNLSGTGEVGASISLYKNNSLVCGSNTVDSSGSFVVVNFSSCLALNEWMNTFTAYARDPSGNTSGTGNTITVTRDSVSPILLYTEVRNIEERQAILEFSFVESHFVDRTAWVEIYNDITLIGTGGIDEYSGNVGYTTLGGLNPNTTYTFILHLIDDAGNALSESGSFTTTEALFRGEVPTDIYETGWVLFGDVDGYVGSGNTFSLGGNNIYISSDPGDSDSASGSLVLSGVDIEVYSGNWNGILLPPSIIDNDNPLAATGSEIGSGVTVVQTVQAGAEWSSLGSTWGYFQVSFMIPGFVPGTIFHIYRSEDGTTWVPVTPDSTCTLDAELMCTFRTDHLSVFAPAFDSVPDAFSFTSKINAELNTSYSSNTITISGINTGTTISITWGEYQIGTGSFTGITGTVLNGDQITVRGTSPSSYNTTNNIVLNIGGVNATYSITTKSTPSGGGGGGGGGSGGPTIDNCPNWDTSWSLYDNRCSHSGQYQSGVTQTGSQKTPFKDIKNSFAQEYIEKLYASWIIFWYPNNTFRPNTAITRGDWIVWVMKAYNIPLTGGTGSTFDDIPRASLWMVPYLNTAKLLGIISWQMVNGKLLFRPNAHITRAEALKILFLTARIRTTSGEQLRFQDRDMKAWMIPYIIQATELGIINGQTIGNKLLFRPNANLTRWEATKLLYKLLITKI